MFMSIAALIFVQKAKSMIGIGSIICNVSIEVFLQDVELYFLPNCYQNHTFIFGFSLSFFKVNAKCELNHTMQHFTLNFCCILQTDILGRQSCFCFSKLACKLRYLDKFVAATLLFEIGSDLRLK